MARLGTLALLISLALAASAGAAIPSGNLIANPGAEASAGATDSTTVKTPTGWTAGNRDSTVTAVAYGTTGGFPSASDALMYGGGINLIAGGPQTGTAVGGEQLVQVVSVSGASPEINSGGVVAKLGACLGGYVDQDDYAQVSATPLGPENQASGNPITLVGPTAAQRGNQTELVGRSAQATLPAGTVNVGIKITMLRPADHGYNDGYADNISLTLRSASDAETSSTCAPQLTSTTPPTGTATPGPTATPAGTPYSADLHLTLAARAKAKLKQVLSPSFKVTNRGPDAAQDVEATVVLAKGTEVLNPGTGCTAATLKVSHKKRLTCPLGTLPSGQTVGRKFQVRRSAGPAITIHANVTSSTGDPVTSDNSADASINLIPKLTLDSAHTNARHVLLVHYTLSEDAKIILLVNQGGETIRSRVRPGFQGSHRLSIKPVITLAPGSYELSAHARDPDNALGSEQTLPFTAAG